MQRTYDFLLQAEPGQAFDQPRAESLAKERGAQLRSDGALVLETPAGEVVILPFQQEGVVQGLEFRVPLEERTLLLTHTLTMASELALAGAFRLVDPQLSRPVTEVDASAVVEAFNRVSSYAAQYFGVGDATSAMVTAAPLDEGMSPVAKAALVVAVFLITMYFAYQFFSSE